MLVPMPPILMEAPVANGSGHHQPPPQPRQVLLEAPPPFSDGPASAAPPRRAGEPYAIQSFRVNKMSAGSDDEGGWRALLSLLIWLRLYANALARPIWTWTALTRGGG